MKAEDVQLTELFAGPKQFIVPVFQRDYSWGNKHCLQLWNDILRIGKDEKSKAHFIGSVVYVAAEDNAAAIGRWLLIDGQQRLTTVTLLLTALRNRISELSGVSAQNPEQQDVNNGLPTPEELQDYYLCNRYGKGDRGHKLHLRRADQETLAALVDGKGLPIGASERIVENFRFFEDQLKEADLDRVYRGIRKLVAVDVSLSRGQDDPQMIFESLNSTGLDLTQADLIRNFVLMRQEEALQTHLYEQYWQPIEIAFGVRYRTEFDKFARDYLTLHLQPSKQLKFDEIYQHFRGYFYHAEANSTVQAILANLKRLGSYYAAFALGQEPDLQLRESFRRLRQLVEATSPLLLRLYDCYSRAKTLSREDFLAAINLLESYVFRRSVCGMETRGYGQDFSSLAYRVTDEDPLLSLKIALRRLGKSKRFPSQTEFREALVTRDIYDMKNVKYLLDRLENHSKEKIDTSSFTIEHILPQNENLSAEWREMLGPEWKQLQQALLHRLGNITLTAYNSEYSDRSFHDKKSIKGGFDESPLRLNKFVREQNKWTATEIEQRGSTLAAVALQIWPALQVDDALVRAQEMNERKLAAAKHSVDDFEFEREARDIFEHLRAQILSLGEDVIELCGSRTVTYRVYEFFVEVIPRKGRLSLLLNVDYDECDDPTGRAKDANEFAFVQNASEKGGVLFSVREQDDVAPAMHLIRQAYEKVSVG